MTNKPEMKKRIKRLAIFDFLHIVLWHYRNGCCNEKGWGHNREKLSAVEKIVEEDKDKIAQALIASGLIGEPLAEKEELDKTKLLDTLAYLELPDKEIIELVNIICSRFKTPLIEHFGEPLDEEEVYDFLNSFVVESNYDWTYSQLAKTICKKFTAPKPVINKGWEERLKKEFQALDYIPNHRSDITAQIKDFIRSETREKIVSDDDLNRGEDKFIPDETREE